MIAKLTGYALPFLAGVAVGVGACRLAASECPPVAPVVEAAPVAPVAVEAAQEPAPAPAPVAEPVPLPEL